jgi:hypothetical protein
MLIGEFISLLFSAAGLFYPPSRNPPEMVDISATIFLQQNEIIFL